MKDTKKTKEQFIEELAELRQRVGELETSEAGHKQVEENLRKSEEQYQLVTDAMPVLISYVDSNQHYRFNNRTYEEWFGGSRSDVYGKHVKDVLGEAAYEAIREHIETVLSGREVMYQSSLPYKEGGIRYIDASYLPHFDARGEVLGFFALVHDITERKQLEEQLRQSQKMEAMGQLTAGIAHNFNNRLMVVLNSFEHLLLIGQFDADILKQGEAATQKAAAIVKQLMLFARSSPETEWQPILMQEIVQEAMAISRKTFDRKIVLRDHLPGDLPSVAGDKNQLDQVFLNLLLNARDALEEGKSSSPCIQVEATRHPSPEADRVRPPSSPPGIYLCIRVRDNGVGMDAETQQHLFEPFFTTKTVDKGTGLGLATVYGIVQEHGGWIECESQVGMGTTFSVYLPVAEAECLSPEVDPENDAPPAGTETILLIEDEEPVLDTLRLMCSRQGYKILEAHNGQEGWEVFQRERERIDLVLLDLSMPEMSGQELLAQMRTLDPQVKVIISTGYTQYRAEALGARALLPKPYRSRQALQTIREVLDE